MISPRLLYRNQAELTRLFRQFAETGKPALTSNREIPADRVMDLDVHQAIEEQIIRFQKPLDESETHPETPRAARIPWPPI